VKTLVERPNRAHRAQRFALFVNATVCAHANLQPSGRAGENAAAANSQLTRNYRKPFVVPQIA